MNYYCPCCGWPGLDSPPYKELDGMCLIRGFAPPYSHHFGRPTYEVCACCGFEYGNDDEPSFDVAGVSFEQTLETFAARGYQWLVPRRMPPQWTLEKQLFGLPTKTPENALRRSKGSGDNGGNDHPSG